ncbi:MAG: prealbumin-like fold domain-containing protein [Acidimicrobiia bacterium]|nr:prealbumin-like fold domain-containing protein [Acidimicrobiia bacterium]
MGHQPGSGTTRRWGKVRRRRLFAASLSLVVSLSLIGFQPAVAEDATDTSGDDPTATEATPPVEETTPPADEQATPPANNVVTPDDANFEVEVAEPPSGVVVPEPVEVPGPAERSELEGDPRTITVHSETVPDDPGPQFTFGFRLEECQEVGATDDTCTPQEPPRFLDPAPVALGDNGAHTWGDLEYDRNYRLSQDASDPAWSLTNLECAPRGPVQSSDNVEARGVVVRLADATTETNTSCVFVNTDASITIHKKADRASNGTVSNLSGALFQVYSNSGYTTAIPGASCTTNASGVCTIAGLTSGTRYVREVTAPANYQRIDTLTTSDDGSQIYGQQFSLGTNTSANTRDFANRRTNPAFPEKCGIKIALVMDLSNSISDTELTEMKTSASAFVDALEGTPSSVAGFTFATDAPASGNANLGLTSVATTGGANTARTWVNNRAKPGGGRTAARTGMPRSASSSPVRPVTTSSCS